MSIAIIMPECSPRRLSTLRKLATSECNEFTSVVSALKQKDLFRLVGVLQTLMLREQQRFKRLSQRLRALTGEYVPNEPFDSELDENDDAQVLLESEQEEENLDPRQNRLYSSEDEENRPPVSQSISDQSIDQKSIPKSLYYSSGEDGAKASRGAKKANIPAPVTVAPVGDRSGVRRRSRSSSTSEHNQAGKPGGYRLFRASQGGVLRLPVDDTDDVDELDARLRFEKHRRDYLARELCLSQSRLAQLCAKNMKVYNMQQERRRFENNADDADVSYQRGRIENVQQQPQQRYSSTPGLLDENYAGRDLQYQHYLQQQQQQQLQQLGSASSGSARKSLSALHKEKKLKELSENNNHIHENGAPERSRFRTDTLKQQVLNSVLTDIFASAANGATEISPSESGYNSSASLRSPSSSALHGQGLQQQQSSVRSCKSEKVALARDDREQRILEQVRGRRASAPTHAQQQHLTFATGANPQDTHRPLKSILKKRIPDSTGNVHRIENVNLCSVAEKRNGVENRAISPQQLREQDQQRSKMEGHEAQPNQLGVSVVSIVQTNGAHQSQNDLEKAVRETLKEGKAVLESVGNRPTVMPIMATHPGPANGTHTAGSPGPVAPVDYPSPVKTGSPSSTKHDLPDVVISKLGVEETTPLPSPIKSTCSTATTASSASVSSESASSKFRSPTSAKTGSPTFEFPQEASPAEFDAFREWDPRPLLRELYDVHYEPRPGTKMRKCIDAEGLLEHLPMNMKPAMATENMWRKHYFQTREGRLLWFENEDTAGIPIGEMSLSGAEVDVDKNACIIVVQNIREGRLLTIRYPQDLLDKWRQALLSYSNVASDALYVKPVYPPIQNVDDPNVCMIELGSCSIRAGLLTSEPSLPQTFFPTVACILPTGGIVPGMDALSPHVRHDGMIVHPITPTQPEVNRYSMNLEIVKHLFRKIFRDLEIDPHSYQVMLSVPQNAPVHMIGALMRVLLTDFGIRGIFVSKQPFLVLYAYDVTTGVVVDFGDRLNIVPVIDGYVVQSAIVSLPYGGYNVADALRPKLIERNWASYSFMSDVERYVLRYVMEKACYVATDFEEEVKRYEENPKDIDTRVDMEHFKPTPEMPTGFDVDASRFTAPEGLFKPKRWGIDIDGLHKLIFRAVQSSPLDSRRMLYRNIYLAGGASLMPGLAERIENELTRLVASSVQVRVRTSPWRDHAAYIGAQVVAGGIEFEQQVIRDVDELDRFIRRLQTANF